MRSRCGSFYSPMHLSLPTPDWLTATLGRDFSLGFEDGVVLSRFASSAAAWTLTPTVSDRYEPLQSLSTSPRRNELHTVFVTGG